jgi:hypothetical protein
MNVVEVEVVVMRVNLLMPSGRHRHCLGTTWVRDSIDVVALRLGLGLSGVGAHEGTLVSEVRPGHPIYCCANRIGAVKMEWVVPPIKVREK